MTIILLYNTYRYTFTGVAGKESMRNMREEYLIKNEKGRY